MNAFDDLRHLPLEQRWRQQVHPVPVVVALIQRKTADLHPQYLLIERRSNTYTGQWALVGGKWDFGETLSIAITREVKEETGLDTDLVAIRGVISERVMPPEQVHSGAHFLIFVCELVALVGEAQEQHEGALGWFTLDDIDCLHASNQIIPSDYAMIRLFAGSIETVPHFEAEMLAAIEPQPDQPIRLLRFERVNDRTSTR